MSNTQDKLIGAAIKNDRSDIQAAAIEYANKTKTITRKCPNNVLNPGLYFGYMAGWEKANERIADLEDKNRVIRGAMNQMAFDLHRFNEKILELGSVLGEAREALESCCDGVNTPVATEAITKIDEVLK